MISRILCVGVVAASLILTGCIEKRRPSGSPQKPPAANPTDGEQGAKGPGAEYGRNLANAEKKAAEVTGLTTLVRAVQQYQVVEGRYPSSLDDLVANRYLQKIPRPPRGKRFTYDPPTGKVDMADDAAVDQPVEAPAETSSDSTAK
jgi:hypothetical protein